MSGPVRVLLCPVGTPPRVASLAADPGGGHLRALMDAVGGTVTCVRLDDGVDLWCNDDALFLGLALNRRIPAVAPELPPGFEDAEVLWLGEGLARPGEPGEWRIHGDFLLARSDARGNLADLTDADVERWTLWLEVDSAVRASNGGDP